MFKHLDLDPWPERVSRPHIDAKLENIPNLRDYQLVDLYLSDGRVLEEVVFIDFSLQDPRLEKYLDMVVDVKASAALEAQFAPPTIPPIKWRQEN